MICVITAIGIAVPLLVRGPAKPVAVSISVPECTGTEAESFSCWQSRYKALTQNDSPEVAFADLKQAFEASGYVRSNCHQITHVIGRAAALKYPDLTTTYQHGDQFCWSGYYHGSIETIAEKIGKDKIESQMTSVCASFQKSKPYGFDHYNCVHGMGHGLLAIEEGQLFTALTLCDTYTDSWEAQSCYGGVFMENVMNEINGAGRKPYLSASDPLYPCTAVASRYKEQCYLMQTSHALLAVQYDYVKVFELCGTVDAPYNETCYQSLGRDVSGQSNSDQARTIELCMQGPTTIARDNCFTGAVKDFMSYYHSDTQGLALCRAIPDAVLAASCVATGQTYYRNF